MKNHSPFRPATAFLAASLAPLLGGATASPALQDFEIRELPASCKLLPAELRKREATLLADLRRQIVAANPLRDGYVLLLKFDENTFKLVTDVIAVERQCCPFLQFRLTVAQESRALLLEMRGPAGSRELLAQVLRLDGPAP